MKLPFYIKEIKESDDFRYKTIADVSFIIDDFKPEDFTLYNGEGAKVAYCINGTLTVLSGYKWDGCTVIGQFTETPESLQASIPHDIFYIAKKNTCGVELNYSLDDVDKYFKCLMNTLYEKAGKKSNRPSIYFTGLKLFGWPWHYNKVKGYTVTKP